jgi:hypothetical protein
MKGVINKYKKTGTFTMSTLTKKHNKAVLFAPLGPDSQKRGFATGCRKP